MPAGQAFPNSVLFPEPVCTFARTGEIQVNRKLIGYWIATGLVCLVFTLGGIANLLHAEAQREIIKNWVVRSIS